MAEYINKYELLYAVDKRNGRLPLWLDEILMEDCKPCDVAPVVHGKWLPTKNEFMGDECFECSNCGYTTIGCDYKYCSNCGAKMCEKEREENA